MTNPIKDVMNEIHDGSLMKNIELCNVDNCQREATTSRIIVIDERKFCQEHARDWDEYNKRRMVGKL